MGNTMAKRVGDSDMFATVWTMEQSSIYFVAISRKENGAAFMNFSVMKDDTQKLLDIWENIEKHVFLRLATE